MASASCLRVEDHGERGEVGVDVLVEMLSTNTVNPVNPANLCKYLRFRLMSPRFLEIQIMNP